MFVKTKNAICEIRNYVKKDNVYKVLDGVYEGVVIKNIYITDNEIISQSENIEDLFDKVIYENEGDIIDAKASRMKVYHITEMQSYEYKVYGAIWCDTNTKPTLKSVAKYENGEWVLL